MLFPGVVNDGQGDAFLERETHFTTVGLVTLLQRRHNVDGLDTIGKRDGDILELLAMLQIDAVNDRECLLADLGYLLIMLLLYQLYCKGDLTKKKVQRSRLLYLVMMLTGCFESVLLSGHFAILSYLLLSYDDSAVARRRDYAKTLRLFAEKHRLSRHWQF